ncbi:MAG: hypothetical protein ACN6QU_19455, partial [Paraburkholderia terricola]
MRAWWCGFALGVMGLQRQAALPDWHEWWMLALLGGGALVVAAWGWRGGSSGGARGEEAGVAHDGLI